ncbi:MAG: DUF2079 domain-containing protein [Planctomycetaceae bacterium]|nr:DUF2079 domain-containing protein [Planctomycetaceae bacterium]
MNDSESRESKKEVDSNLTVLDGIAVVLVILLLGNALQLIAETPSLIQSFFSPGLSGWLALNLLAGTAQPLENGGVEMFVSLTACLAISAVLTLLALAIPFAKAAPQAFRKSLMWISLPGIWGLLWLVAAGAIMTGLTEILQVVLIFVVSGSIAGVLYELTGHRRRSQDRAEIIPDNQSTERTASLQGFRSLPQRGSQAILSHPVLTGMMLCYVVVFVAMNWGLWFNLQIPHGDSSMYEEHLWNVMHGKGFRSYLDQGLFWGEHIQFVHLFLLPVYVFWPSHLLLELAESLALASGAIPVYLMTLRSCGDKKAALWLAGAYLCYFPMQFLDIAIDLKTFRPIAFGIPLVLWALQQLETGRYRNAAILLGLSLTCKEDYAIVIFSIGLALLLLAWKSTDIVRSKALMKFGLAAVIIGPAYLFLAIRLIRWFRSGVEVHYAGYFSRFGGSASEVVWTMLTDPGRVIGALATVQTLAYLLAIFLPLAFLPLRSPLRLISTFPMLVLLCLNELAQDPRHHFHAPLIPLVFWCAATGLSPRSRSADASEQNPAVPELSPRNWSRAVFCCCVATQLWFSLSPLGMAFWDQGSRWYAGRLYFPDERATAFPEILPLIPQDSRVASTDFVHPRFTHFERSYDYSNYARRVSGGTTNVPEDTDFIVIDTAHPYSEIKHPEQIRELQEAPEQWELLDDHTGGLFLVLRRRSPAGNLE